MTGEYWMNKSVPTYAMSSLEGIGNQIMLQGLVHDMLGFSTVIGSELCYLVSGSSCAEEKDTGVRPRAKGS
jgi:hypothetical protein